MAVTIYKSSFDNNVGGTGLLINSIGVITLMDVSANNNDSSGAYLANDSGWLNLAVNIYRSNFDANVDDGLVVFSRGNILLSVVSAGGNGLDGAYLDNDGNVNPLSVITVLGPSFFYCNGAVGLEANASRMIYANGIKAGYNGDAGVALETWNGPITVSNGLFENNTAHGLSAITVGGDITISNVQSFSNGLGAGMGAGLYLDSGYRTIRLVNVAVHGNGDHGIMASFHYMFLTNVTRFANNRDSNGSKDLYFF
jgi:hypothetical protein